MAQRVLFEETRRFGQPWLWILLGIVAVVSLTASAGLGVTIVAVVVVLFFLARLTTEVREDGVYVRFAPFHRSFRELPFDDIERCETTEFGLLTYGGLGIRWTPETIAYTTSRGAGVELHRAGRKSVVIGSERAEELVAAIDQRL